MAYSRFPNINELLQGNLNTKLMGCISSRNFLTLKCNCRKPSSCLYNGLCGQSIVVYQATCLLTRKRYIGNTQQHVKKRMQQHVQDTKNLFVKNKKSDTFASHFTQLIPTGTPPSEVRKHVKFSMDILWKGDPVSCVSADFCQQSIPTPRIYHHRKAY